MSHTDLLRATDSSVSTPSEGDSQSTPTKVDTMNREIERWLTPSLERDWESFPRGYCTRNSKTSLLGLFHVIDRSVIEIMTQVNVSLSPVPITADLFHIAGSKPDEEKYHL